MNRSYKEIITEIKEILIKYNQSKELINQIETELETIYQKYIAEKLGKQ